MKTNALRNDDARAAIKPKHASCTHGMSGNMSHPSPASRSAFVAAAQRARRRNSPRIQTIRGPSRCGSLVIDPKRSVCVVIKGSPSTNLICMFLDHGMRTVKGTTNGIAWSVQRRNQLSHVHKTSKKTQEALITVVDLTIISADALRYPMISEQKSLCA
jgi:hypothetical protein